MDFRPCGSLVWGPVAQSSYPEWHTRDRIGRGTGLVAVAAYIGIERHGRRLEWRPLTSNVYYSSHSDTRKSSLLCIRTSVENGGPWRSGAHHLAYESPHPPIHMYSSIIVMLVELPSVKRHSPHSIRLLSSTYEFSIFLSINQNNLSTRSDVSFDIPLHLLARFFEMEEMARINIFHSDHRENVDF